MSRPELKGSRSYTLEEFRKVRGTRVVEREGVVGVKVGGRSLFKWDRGRGVVWISPGWDGGCKMTWKRIGQGLEALGVGVKVCGKKVVENSRGVKVVWVEPDSKAFAEDRLEEFDRSEWSMERCSRPVLYRIGEEELSLEEICRRLKERA